MDRKYISDIIELIYTYNLEKALDTLEDDYLSEKTDDDYNFTILLSALYNIACFLIDPTTEIFSYTDDGLLEEIDDLEIDENELPPWTRALYAGWQEKVVNTDDMSDEDKLFIKLYPSDKSHDIENLFGPHDWRTILAKYPIVNSCNENDYLNAIKEAEEHLDKAHQIFFFVETADFYSIDQEDYSTALKYYLKAYELSKDVYGKNSLNTFYILERIDEDAYEGDELNTIINTFKEVADDWLDENVFPILKKLANIYSYENETETELELWLNAVTKQPRMYLTFSELSYIAERLYDLEKEEGGYFDLALREIFERMKALHGEDDDTSATIISTLIVAQAYKTKDIYIDILKEFEDQCKEGSALNTSFKFIRASFLNNFVNNYKEALEIFLEIKEPVEKNFGKASQKYISLRFSTAGIYRAQGKENKWMNILKELASIIEKEEIFPTECAEILMAVALDLRDEGKLKKAIKYIEIARNAYDNGDIFISLGDYGFILAELSRTYSANGEFEKAYEAGLEGYEILKDEKGESDIDAVVAEINLAYILFASGDVEGSLKQAKECLKHTNKKNFDVNLKANIIVHIASCNLMLSKAKEAKKNADKALSLLESNMDSDNELIMQAAYVLAMAYLYEENLEKGNEIITHYGIEELFSNPFSFDD